MDHQRLRLRGDSLFIHNHFGDAFHSRQLEHGIEQNVLKDGTQTPRTGFTLDGLFGNRRQGFVGEVQFGIFQFKETLILFDQSVLGLGQDGDVENSIGIVLFGQKIAGASILVWKGKQAQYTLSNLSMTDVTIDKSS